jgi:outer membrane protein
MSRHGTNFALISSLGYESKDVCGQFGGIMRRVYIALRALAVCTPALGALAASAADLGGSYKDGDGAADEWAITGAKVGGVLVVMPKYEGSKDYEVLGFPYILPTFSGGPGFFSRVDARGLDDVRFNLIDRNGFVAGPLGGYTFGREEDDGDRLDGLGDIDGGVVLGGFVGYRLGPVLFDASYHQFFDDSEGYQIRFGAEMERQVSQRVTLTGRVGATYADENYTQTYFGVSAAQAIDSPLLSSAYEAEAGFKDVHVQVGIKADLDDRWSARASVRYSHLLGDAGDSPLVESEDQFMGLVGLSYKFYSER